tara:strand:- start:34265 stop:34420 length:156 start_codon:yes stop_codon:yes gene_type:complete
MLEVNDYIQMQTYYSLFSGVVFAIIITLVLFVIIGGIVVTYIQIKKDEEQD